MSATRRGPSGCAPDNADDAEAHAGITEGPAT